MPEEMASRFDFKNIEHSWCDFWEKNHIFHAEADRKKPSYSIVIPPPNVTGILHMGHALNNTLQDILIRYQRMKGCQTCWMPGTDHAGIATQNVVEKQLAKENKTRYDLGREKLLERLWEWKKEYGDTIINQLKKLGSSCDWDRTRFTMDDDYSEAVRHVFVSLYEKGLIYQGEYIINWCPRCHTALSDEEAEHQEHRGALYYIHYSLKDNPSQHLTVATTRPETMLGDTAVAVNPNDKRYKDFIGKTLILPIVNREIPVIADDFVDPEFGTGAVKVTPAHDPNDFQMGQRHSLPMINVMHPDGRMNNEAGEFAGMDRFEAREAIIELLHELKILEKTEDHHHAVGHCYRCHTVVEPYLSKQWFVKMKPLAEPALKVVQKGKITFYPERWTKVYCNWLENIRDWCISRQIWWGHRIPVWYCKSCGEMTVALKDPDCCSKCKSKEIFQDEDVLDTWFSSWLWPFATFGWPQHKEDVKYFYPTNSLFTASEIIFFWVARMVMAGIEFMGDIPFSKVVIHGTVRDSQGRKMSKSLGNALDPLEIIEEYGADALRFSLIINSGQDIYISKDKFEIGRNFANKIWNASRFVLMKTTFEKKPLTLKNLDLKQAGLPSQWIVSRLTQTVESVGKAIEEFHFSEAETLVHEFFWGDFCDWYLEIVKPSMDDVNIQKIMFFILEQSLRLMHPFLPFVTEEIWKHINISEKCLSLESWPDINKNSVNQDAENAMNRMKDIVTGIRNIKAQWRIKPQQSIQCTILVADNASKKLIADNADIITTLSRCSDLAIEQTQDLNIEKSASAVIGNIKIFVPLGDVVDIDNEIARIEKDRENIIKSTQALEKRLNSEKFLNNAPKDIVEKDRQRLADMQKNISAITDVLKGFKQ